MSMREQMAKIKSDWGAFIARAVQGTALPEEFMGALIGNESGGLDDAKRFEKGVYAHLVAVQIGTEAAYGRLKQADLHGLGDDALRGLATSWGATQIMGWVAILNGVDYCWLETPWVSMGLTVKLLVDFAKEWRLDLAKDFGQLLRCWNTGRPDGRTFDPLYVTVGLERMKIYREVQVSWTN